MQILDSTKSVGLIVSHHIITVMWNFDARNHCEKTEWFLFTRKKYDCTTNKEEKEIENFLDITIVKVLSAFLPQSSAAAAIRTKSRQLINLIQNQLNGDGRLSIILYLAQRHTADGEIILRGYLHYMLWRECENFIVWKFGMLAATSSASNVSGMVLPLPQPVFPFDVNKLERLGSDGSCGRDVAN